MRSDSGVVTQLEDNASFERVKRCSLLKGFHWILFGSDEAGGAGESPVVKVKVIELVELIERTNKLISN